MAIKNSSRFNLKEGIEAAIQEYLKDYSAEVVEATEKVVKEIAADSGKAALVALGTSSMTATINFGLDPAKNPCLSLMTGMTEPFRNTLSAFFGALDDAATYLFLMER